VILDICMRLSFVHIVVSVRLPLFVVGYILTVVLIIVHFTVG
jgi:hypothetical protein